MYFNISNGGGRLFKNITITNNYKIEIWKVERRERLLTELLLAASSDFLKNLYSLQFSMSHSENFHKTSFNSEEEMSHWK